MPELPPCDPERIGLDKLHEKLLDARLAAQFEQQKADMASVKARLDAEIEEDKAELAGELDAEATELAEDFDLRELYHQKVMEVAAGAFERTRDSAKFVQTAAAAVLTAYAALLGLVFSAQNRPLPLRGIYAAVYLGLATALAIAYLAFLKEGNSVDAYVPGPSVAETQLARTSAFIDWVNGGVANRRNALRASVVAFAFGVAFLPAAFVGATGASATTATDAPIVPAIPRSVPSPIAEEASRLFTFQVDAYLAAVAKGGSPGAVAVPEKACTGYWQTLQACAWTTEIGVERAFRRLAFVALVVVVLVPSGMMLYEKGLQGNRSRL